MDRLDDLKGTVHAELQEVLAGLRPATSADYTRHLPDAALVELVVVKILVPILTSVMSGILTHWATSRSDNKKADKISSELQNLRDRLEKIAALQHFDEGVEREFEETVSIFWRMQSSDSALAEGDIDERGIERDVANVLEQYHIGPKTAARKSGAIVSQVLRRVKIKP